MNEFTWSVRVYYEDTDAAGIVYHANYLKFMERARTEWLRQLGFEQTQLLEKHHLAFVVWHMSIDYLKPAIFNDALQVTVQVAETTKASFTLQQKVLRQTDNLCRAIVKLACIHTGNLRPRPIPPTILRELAQHG